MSKALTICIVTSDIVGPIRNGGIGTVYYNLALALARDGHRVTVLYALGQHCENKTVAHWTREYAAHDVAFVPLPFQDVEGHHAIKMSYSIYCWLKTREFDIVHYHEWRGLGFYSALAKRQGLCLANTLLCVGAHAPTLWQLEGMNELANAEALEVDFMERESVALADVLWSPSAHMVEWLRREGWKLPKRIVRKPYIVLDLELSTAPPEATVKEFVFFGRLETRKGLDIFCDALDRLVKRQIIPPAVTFLGKFATVNGMPSEEYLRKRSEKWPFRWKIISRLDRDAAIAYLRAPGRVAVLPSRIDNLPYTVLECLGAGIPFIAAATGGIPEMIRARDQERVLFALKADAFADRLADIIRNGPPAPKMRMLPDRVLAGWLRWHRRAVVARKHRPVRPRQTRPLPRVSVVITHHNRPAFLAAALESIRQQDYPNFDVVVVDDGSDLPKAQAYLLSLEDEFASKGWTIVRQPNKYPGAARNAGVAASRGEFILFMDDDNLALPHEISTFVRAAQSSGAGILTCFLDTFQSNEPNPGPKRAFLWPFLGGAAAPGLLRNVFGDANALIRRDVFARVGPFTEDFGVSAEDWEFFARAVLSGVRLEVVPEALMRYRQSPTGFWQSTSAHTNRMRAIRPYFELVPSHLRPLVHLANADGRHLPAASTAATVAPAALDHVQRAVVFGTGEAGRLAIDLARRCGWDVPWVVDNNPSTWETTAHGKPVRRPDSLTPHPVDLVIIASLAGKPAISAQLEQMGFTSGTDFVHFLDAVKVGGTTLQLSLP